MTQSPEVLNKYDKDGFAPVHHAIWHSNHDMTKMLIEKNPEVVKKANKDGYTPLHTAAYKKDPKTADTVLKVSKDISMAKDKKGSIHHYIMLAGMIIKKLLKHY